MSDWNTRAIVDDTRPLIAGLVGSGRHFALATIARAEDGPRPVGTQMVITPTQAWGFLSGGCIEENVALHARELLVRGGSRWLVYGRGSPFIDMRLPCGGRIEILVEVVSPDDPAIRKLLYRWSQRLPAYWRSDGLIRACGDSLPIWTGHADSVQVTYWPRQRLAVVGIDPFALSIANMGQALGWQTVLIAPFGPSGVPPFGLSCDRRAAGDAIRALQSDQWTAIALATHDVDLDEEALLAAFETDVGYIGLLGSRRRLAVRSERLRARHVEEEAIARLHAPIGLAIGATTPREVAAGVIAEIIQVNRMREDGMTTAELGRLAPGVRNSFAEDGSATPMPAGAISTPGDLTSTSLRG